MRRRRSGYVLILILLLLALAAVAMHSVILISMDSGLKSVGVQDELQRRWGMLSCQQVLLPQAAQILQQAESAAKHPLASVHRELVLGRQRFELLFADEQAKANVNLLYDRLPRQDLERALQALAGGDQRGLRLRLLPLREAQPTPEDAAASLSMHGIRPPIPPSDRPTNVPRAANASRRLGPVTPAPAPATTQSATQPVALQPLSSAPPAFESFGELFGAAAPQTLLGREGQGPSAELTCWGPGQVNFYRAPNAVLQRVCNPPLSEGEVGQLLDARARTPEAPLSKLLEGMSLEQVRRVRVQQLLSDRSTCYSLWIVSHAGPRSYYRLAIQEAGREKSRTLCYEW